MEVTTFDELLRYLTTGGAVVIVSWTFSWLFEGYDFWEKLPRNAKSGIVLLFSVLLGVGAFYVSTLPAEEYEALRQIGTVIVATCVAWLGTQVAHRNNSLRR